MLENLAIGAFTGLAVSLFVIFVVCLSIAKIGQGIKNKFPRLSKKLPTQVMQVKQVDQSVARAEKPTGNLELRKLSMGRIPKPNNKHWRVFDNNGNEITNMREFNLFKKNGANGYVLPKSGSAGHVEFPNLRIPLKNSFPQFHEATGLAPGQKIVFGEVGMPDGKALTSNRDLNMDAFDFEQAAEWRKNPHSIPDEFIDTLPSNPQDITPQHVKNIRLNQSLPGRHFTWHEMENGRAILMPRELHASLPHTGGVSIAKKVLANAPQAIRVAEGQRIMALKLLVRGGP